MKKNQRGAFELRFTYLLKFYRLLKFLLISFGFVRLITRNCNNKDGFMM